MKGLLPWIHRYWKPTVTARDKLGAHAMKRVAAGAHLPTTWFFEPGKRPDNRADYCLDKIGKGFLCTLARERQVREFYINNRIGRMDISGVWLTKLDLPLRLRTHFGSRFFSRLSSRRSWLLGMTWSARRANNMSSCKYEDHYSKFYEIRIQWDLKNNSDCAEIWIERRKMHWFQSIWPENLFGLRDNSEYAIIRITPTLL